MSDLPASLPELEAAHAIAARRGGAAQRIPRWWYVAALTLVVASWWLVVAAGRGRLVPDGLARRASGFLHGLLGTGSAAPPAYTQPQAWIETVGPAVDTLAMSLLAVGLAGAAALATVAFAARNLTVGAFSRSGPVAGRAVLVATRGVHILTRAVPDLVWALLIVFVLQPGVLAGALALGLHNFGVLGRLGADVVEDVDPGPLRTLQSSGAGSLQMILFGVLPQVLPQFLTFLLYRWEVIIRASAVVGFVAAAGIGYQLRLDLSFFRYTHVALVLLVYVLLVWLVDLASAGLRRLAR